MAGLWAAFLEFFQLGLFWLTQFYGGHLASAIVSFSILVRLLLLPATVRMSLRARAHARRIRALKPELDRVKARWHETPDRLASETLAVYRRAGVSPMDLGLVRSSLLQTPVLLGLYHSIRALLTAGTVKRGFFWVIDIARPDFAVAVLAAASMALAGWAGASESQPTWTLGIPAVVSGIMALTLSAGLGLYLVASGLVGTLQGLMVRRIERRGGHAF